MLGDRRPGFLPCQGCGRCVPADLGVPPPGFWREISCFQGVTDGVWLQIFLSKRLSRRYFLGKDLRDNLECVNPLLSSKYMQMRWLVPDGTFVDVQGVLATLGILTCRSFTAFGGFAVKFRSG
jgi:hypothetical protein